MQQIKFIDLTQCCKAPTHLFLHEAMSLFINLSLTPNLPRSFCQLSSLYESLIPRENFTILTFHRGRSVAILSQSGVSRYNSVTSVLYASVRACQSSAQSFGRVNSNMYRTRRPLETTLRPQWTAHASGRFQRMASDARSEGDICVRETPSQRIRSTSTSSSHIRCHASMLSMGTGIHRGSDHRLSAHNVGAIRRPDAFSLSTRALSGAL